MCLAIEVNHESMFDPIPYTLYPYSLILCIAERDALPCYAVHADGVHSGYVIVAAPNRVAHLHVHVDEENVWTNLVAAVVGMQPSALLVCGNVARVESLDTFFVFYVQLLHRSTVADGVAHHLHSEGRVALVMQRTVVAGDAFPFLSFSQKLL